ncbi:MAG TPA: helix-turn-helix domain-containing protein [Gemmatimonadales bacterium]|jgi:sugar-specific transcriptional regulator TrmB
MPGAIDLTPFGFTPTESLIYEVLLRGGPGTGYTIARAAGLARANVYAALEGLAAKGAARISEGRPKQFRPEPPSTLLARLSDRQGEAMDHLGAALATLTVPDTPTLVELSSPRGAVQLMGHEIARATEEVDLVAPPDGCLALAPQLRRASAVGVTLVVASTGPVPLGVTSVEVISPTDWPGEPVLLVVDRRAALIGSRHGDTFSGHWGRGPAFVAAARRACAALRAGQ